MEKGLESFWLFPLHITVTPTVFITDSDLKGQQNCTRLLSVLKRKYVIFHFRINVFQHAHLFYKRFVFENNCCIIHCDEGIKVRLQAVLLTFQPSQELATHTITWCHLGWALVSWPSMGFAVRDNGWIDITINASWWTTSQWKQGRIRKGERADCIKRFMKYFHSTRRSEVLGESSTSRTNNSCQMGGGNK